MENSESSSHSFPAKGGINTIFYLSNALSHGTDASLLQKAPQRWFSINEGIKTALAIVISWSDNKKVTRQKSQERLKSDLGLWLFGILVRRNNKLELNG